MSQDISTSWEKEFDERFPSSFTRIDGKDFIEISSFATSPVSLKAFIRTQIEKAERRARIEIEEKIHVLPRIILNEHDYIDTCDIYKFLYRDFNKKP